MQLESQKERMGRWNQENILEQIIVSNFQSLQKIWKLRFLKLSDAQIEETWRKLQWDTS